MPERTALLVLGLGNVLCGDDGLGAIAVHLLQRDFRAPRQTVVLDGGTLGLSLLPLIQDAERVLMVDAIRHAGAQPGAAVRIQGDEVMPAVRERLSVHQIGVADLLDGARLLGCCPPNITLLGLVPQDLGLGVGLSPPVKRAMPGLVATIVAEARALGFEFVPKPYDEKSSRMDDARDVASVLGLWRAGC
jgi:hydrogenase maturation protease